MTQLLCNTVASAAEPVTPAEAVRRARQAVGYEALRRHQGEVLLEGTGDYLGMPASWRVRLSPDGKFLQTIETHGSHQLGRAGKIIWEQAFSHNPRILDFGEAEGQRAFLAVRTHAWLAEDSPYQITPVTGEEKEGEMALQLAAADDLVPTQIVLDRRTWLPIRASRPWLFGNTIWEFSDYAEFHGTQWPRQSQIHHGQAVDRFEVKEVHLVPRGDPSAYAPPKTASSIAWDANLPSRVELKRTRSGHFFVKVRVNDQDAGWFTFDTGTGSGLTINRKIAEQLHLPAFGKTFAGGAGRLNPTQFRQAASLQIGPATMKAPVFYELPPAFTDGMAKAFGFEWGGTIGHDVLSQVVAELDLSVPALDLKDPTSHQLKRGAWQSLRLNHGVPCLQCRIEDQWEGWFQLDTGAGPLAIVHSPAVERHHLLKDRTTQSHPLQGVGGAIDAQAGRLKDFSVGGRTAANVLAFFVTGKEGALTDPYTMGTFGPGILGSDITVIFDYGHQRAALMGKE